MANLTGVPVSGLAGLDKHASVQRIVPIEHV